jgi:hypothetical protein
LIDRHIAGLSTNRVWLYTVDKCNEIDRDSRKLTGNVIVRIVRWRAINDKKNKKLKYWRMHRSYNIRSSDEWISTSELVNVMIDEKMKDSNFIVIPKEEYEKLTDDKKDALDLMQKIRKLKTEKSARNAQLDLFKKSNLPLITTIIVLVIIVFFIYRKLRKR